MSASCVYNLPNCHNMNQSNGHGHHLKGLQWGELDDEDGERWGVEASVSEVSAFRHHEDVTIDILDRHHHRRQLPRCLVQYRAVRC